jgi:hypothetical protein
MAVRIKKSFNNSIDHKSSDKRGSMIGLQESMRIVVTYILVIQDIIQSLL